MFLLYKLFFRLFVIRMCDVWADYEACRRRVQALCLAQEPARCGAAQRALFLRTALDLRQPLSVHALGALLRHLDLHWPSLSLDLHGKPQFLTLKRISL